jgi:hypothetical protein
MWRQTCEEAACHPLQQEDTAEDTQFSPDLDKRKFKTSAIVSTVERSQVTAAAVKTRTEFRFI